MIFIYSRNAKPINPLIYKIIFKNHSCKIRLNNSYLIIFYSQIFFYGRVTMIKIYLQIKLTLYTWTSVLGHFKKKQEDISDNVKLNEKYLVNTKNTCSQRVQLLL